MQVDDGRIEHQSPLPFHQRGPHPGDPALPDRTIIPAVKTVPDTTGIHEIFMRPEHTIRPPMRQQPAFFVVGVDRRYFSAIDVKPAAHGVDFITGAGGDGFENVPVPTGAARALLDIRPCSGRYPEIDDPSYGRPFIHPQVNSRRHAGRGVDHNLPIRQQP